MTEPDPRDDRRTIDVIGSPIDAIDWDAALARIERWAAAGDSRYVCLCNAHSLVTARQDEAFGRIVREADLATPDGAPVAWMMRRLGGAGQARINGPDLMWAYCAAAARKGEPIFLYGGTEATLAALRRRLAAAFPDLRIAGALSPPFRALSDEEDRAVIAAINASGAKTVWVGLGCPKQERWMAGHRGRVHAVMIGVGAAFDYHAGTLPRAPAWMRRTGLEWLFRLACEPRRLWKRYLVTNTLFIARAAGQLLFRRP